MKKVLVTIVCMVVAQITWATTTNIMADSTVQVQLTTNGTVAFTGGNSAISGLKGLANKAQNQADTIIKRAEQKAQNEQVYFTKKEDRGKSHGSTSIAVPKNFNLKFQTATGNVSLTDVDGKVKGKVENGAINIVRGKGKVELNTDAGDVTITESAADGFVITKKGNVTLQDVRGNLTGLSQSGKVTFRTTSSYFTGRKLTAFALNYDEADIDIAAAPEGGQLNVGKGNISVSGVQKNIAVATNEGNLTVATANTGVRARTNKGKASVQVSANSTATDPIIIETQDGDADLLVASNFAGSFVITLIQTKNLTTRNVVSSFINLGTVRAEEVTDPKTKMVTSRITQVIHVVSNGRRTRPVRIRVVNGNINIKRI